jgi:L-ascorbate 6-phosphate lactonase
MVGALTVWGAIQAADVQPGTVALWWLYQAGFALKASDGSVILIDPYLSDAVWRSYRQSRGVPAPFNAADVAVDAVLATHSHEDHLDPDSVADFARSGRTVFVGCRSAMQRVMSHGVDCSRTRIIARGETVRVGPASITAVAARHMVEVEPTPDAIGLLVEIDGVRVYHSGDTEYDSRIIADVSDVSVAMVCINGSGGNMDAHESALLAWRLHAGIAVPMHHRLWVEGGYGAGATLDPQVFTDTYMRLSSGTGRVHTPQPGRAFIVGAPK